MHNYRALFSLYFILFLPFQHQRDGYLLPANEVWGKVIFLHLFVILFTGGHVWLLGGMCGCWGACMVAGGHAWLQGACMVARGCAWLLGGACIGYDEIWSMSGR